MHDGGAMAQGAPLDSFQSFVDDFTERTRELKSLLLLRSSELDPNSQKVMEEMEGAIAKAERSMNSRAEELMLLCDASAGRAQSIKKAFSEAAQQGGGTVRAESRTEKPASSSSSSSSAAAAVTSRAGPPSINSMTEKEVQGVPQYVRGRCGLTKLNAAIAAINDVLAVREELMGKGGSKLSEGQREQVKGWKELEAAHGNGNKPVLREEDLKTAGLRLSESSSKEVLGVLKHAQRLREVRAASGDKAYVCSA